MPHPATATRDDRTLTMPKPVPAPLAAPRLRRAAAVVALAAWAMPAASQGLDLGALEQIFGEPVTTSATGKPQRSSDVPVAMDIITAEQIRRSGARDLPEVLARYTSLDVQRFNAADYAVGVRGFATPATPRVLVLLNGRQVYLDDFGETVWSTLPVQLAEIRQIEVVRGPNSALFGFNAAAGVINIVTFSPLHDRVNTASVRLGSHGYREASGVATVPVGARGGIRLSAGLRQEHDWNHGFNTVDQLFGGRADPRRANIAFDGQARVTDSIAVGFDASYSQVRAGELMTFGAVAQVDRSIWSLRGRIAAETSHGLVEATLYRNAETAEIPAIRQHAEQSVTVLQLSDTMKLGADHTLRPFAEYRYTEGQRGPTGLDFSVGAAGLMWNWAISSQVETTAALRYDHLWLGASNYGLLPDLFPASAYRRDWGTLAWNLGLVWKPSTLDAARLSVARGISTPSLSQLGPPGVVGSPVGLGFSGSPLLKPTIVDNYEIGYRRRVGLIDGTIDAAAFYQVNHDFNSGLAVGAPAFVPGVPFPVSAAMNIGSARAYGAEASATSRLGHGVDADLRYRLVVTDTDLIPTPLEYKHASPRHLLTSRLGWAGGPWEADLFGRYSTTMQGFRFTERGYVPVRVDDVLSIAARVAHRFQNGFILALEASDIVQQRQRQGIGLEAERRVYLSLRANF